MSEDKPMKVAVVGGGFTGLSAAFFLSRLRHKVTVFEKEETLGGLAGTFKLPSAKWAVEKHYHHWFTNDSAVLSLVEQLGLANRLFFPKTATCLYYKGGMYPFDTPLGVLSFPHLSLSERLRTGAITFFLRLLPARLAINLEKYKASEWLKKYYGEKAFRIVWEPLLLGKFGKYEKQVNMAWFWARIKKRTPELGYLEGGYQILLSALSSAIKKNGGKILLSQPFDPSKTTSFDKVIVTTPSKIFVSMYPQLPAKYKKQLSQIAHLDALNLLLVTNEKILSDCYWLNINDGNFPFIALVQHTNLAKAKYYGGQHLTWVANYLPPDHSYLKMTKEELFQTYLPYLKKINPTFNFELLTLNFELFIGPFAQPVFPTRYSQMKPCFATPVPNVYLANMDMVYPWDRGTNYAIELGNKVAEYVITQ